MIFLRRGGDRIAAGHTPLAHHTAAPSGLARRAGGATVPDVCRAHGGAI
ncbi:hypothetical protein OG230_01195 [Streptomyces sp. NBC_00234]|nr:hypothetical protein [Streptomyces sp. NBC_00234]